MKIEQFLKASPIFAINHANQSLCKAFNRGLRPEQVNILQSLVLLAVFFETGRPVFPSQLARAFGTSLTNMSHCLSHLEKLRFIQRELNPRDSRSYVIVIRPLGTKAAQRLIRTYHQAQERFEKQVGVRALQQALATIALLTPETPAARR